MIMLRLIGGLGNQMFQYACGRMLAQTHQTALKLDISNYADDPLRHYSLGCFNLKAELATPKEIQHIGGSLLAKNTLRRSIAKKLEQLKPYYRRRFIHEQGFGFDANILQAPNNICLYNGYWQSEQYFRTIQTMIRQELSIKHKLSGNNAQVAEHIYSTEAISIHVRRGDYATNLTVQQQHGILDAAYYQKSLEHLTQYTQKPVLFIFSDDVAWCKANLQLAADTYYVDNNNDVHNYEDLRLMSLCKHHIIANSSFSWWGAWLNSNPAKQVCAPKQWFKTTNRNTHDIIPDSWAKIANEFL